MRRLTLLAVLVLGLAACGGSGVPKDALTIKFGRVGASIISYTITIAPGGAVTSTGSPQVTPLSLTSAQDEALSHQVRAGFGKLKNMQCAKALPDESPLFITALGKTVTVRGECEPAFTTLYVALANAVGLSS